MRPTARALLAVMSLRLALQDSGVARATPSLQQATLHVVAKLAEVNPEESIDVVFDENRQRCTYVRMSTDEVLAEMSLPNTTT